MTPTPEEIIAICLDNSWDRDGGYWYGFGKTVTPRQLRDSFEQVHTALAASQERVRELAADNMKWRKLVNEYRLSILLPVLPETPPSTEDSKDSKTEAEGGVHG